MEKTAKDARLKEIRGKVVSFCVKHLNEELQGYALKLCDTLARKRKISISRGKKEIWAASIIYVIARLNFLFDKENDFFVSPDTICDFFGVKKSTIGSKATQIEKACNLGMGAEGFCSPEISDALTLVKLPNGFVAPKSMLPNSEIVTEDMRHEIGRSFQECMAQLKRIAKQNEAEQRAQRAEVREKEAKDKRKKRGRQLSLFDEHS